MTTEQIEQHLIGPFYLAKAEIEDASKLQPGDYLVHVNDVTEALNTLQKRIVEKLGATA